MDPHVSAHWRETARPAMFGMVSVYAVFPLMVTLLFFNTTTLAISVLSTLFFAIIERFGMTPIIFLRWLRAKAAGPYRHARPWWIYQRNRRGPLFYER